MTKDDNEEWEEYQMQITFEFTYVNEGPFPEDMPDEKRKEQVKDDFKNEWSEQFYQAYTSAQRHQLETSEPEKYER